MEQEKAWSVRPALFKGLAALGLGLGGFALWAFTTEIQSAVPASGHIEVEARRQIIQHPDGGLVASISVQEGEMVEKGQEILRLDGTELEARRAELDRGLRESWARLDRLRAEILEEPRVAYRPELRASAEADAEIAALLREETRLFDLRRASLERMLRLLEERQRHSEEAIRALLIQLGSSDLRLQMAQELMAAQEILLQSGASSRATVLNLRIELERLRGERGGLEAQIADARGEIAEYEGEILRIQDVRREEAQSMMRQIQPEEARMREQSRVVQTRLGRLALRAPMAGAVLDLRVHTVGGVIGAGAEAASIVPADAALILVAEISPADIDRVYAGQAATIRFPNFTARTTPEIEGTVKTVSADAMTNPATGARYFTVELTLSAEGRRFLEADGRELVPGMPVEAYIRTGGRTPASFLLKPVEDYLSHALREE
ncbi:HlyD family type I secretion periplasmic adaptor subunit [Neomegalonema perideroedes]|uniref:HlyD family type I secretion periplasmic adaptor subunit n=1 Tax=Neomegalonema perideroedes TaxID=217219 RepID=UPI0003781EF8|nr:HlyD family type I secretion periplasmic adaptor subunit [Neomegalonema perideroedes]